MVPNAARISIHNSNNSDSHFLLVSEFSVDMKTNPRKAYFILIYDIFSMLAILLDPNGTSFAVTFVKTGSTLPTRNSKWNSY